MMQKWPSAILEVVGTPLSLTVWASDDGIRRRRRDQDREGGPPPLVRLAWSLHQGPASVNLLTKTSKFQRMALPGLTPPSPSPNRANTYCAFSPQTDRAAAARSVAGPTHSCA